MAGAPPVISWSSASQLFPRTPETLVTALLLPHPSLHPSPVLRLPILPPRYPAEEGAGAEGAGGQEGARGQRRGHHPVTPHRGGVQRVGRRLRARRERVVRLKGWGGRTEAGGKASLFIFVGESSVKFIAHSVAASICCGSLVTSVSTVAIDNVLKVKPWKVTTAGGWVRQNYPRWSHFFSTLPSPPAHFNR